MAYGIIPLVGASLIADLLKEAREVATPSASEFDSDRGKGIGAAMERPFIVIPFASRRSLSSSSRGAVTFGLVQCCHGTGVSCCGVHKQDATSRGQVVNGNIRAALGVRSLIGQAVDRFAPGVKASRAAEFVEIIAETIMGDCTMLKTVPEVVSKGSKGVCWYQAGIPEDRPPRHRCVEVIGHREQIILGAKADRSCCGDRASELNSFSARGRQKLGNTTRAARS